MRIYKLKGFARFQRKERIADRALAKAVEDAEAGLIDADLGGGLYKQRIARRGQGKSGGYRTLVAFRQGDLALFLYGFAKSDRANVDDDELEAWRRIARVYLGLDAEKLEQAVAAKEITEVQDGQTD
jgi:hypothetical protein